MNIFYLDNHVKECAKAHCDKHVVKMILETAQLLSTAHHVLGGNGAVYKKTHENHPCAKWVRESAGNYFWAWGLMIALGKEYKFRFGRDHKTIVDHERTLFQPPNELHGLPTVPPLAMPDACKIGGAIDSYRQYYLTEKKELLHYTRREPPEWMRKNLDMISYIKTSPKESVRCHMPRGLK